VVVGLSLVLGITTFSLDLNLSFTWAVGLVAATMILLRRLLQVIHQQRHQRHSP
jgi:hypothetical protein